MQRLIENFDNGMKRFCEEYESLEKRIETSRVKMEEEEEAMIYIKAEIKTLIGDIDDEARRIVTEGVEYTPPDGPPSLVKLSYALQELYTRKVSLKLLENEHERYSSIMEATHKQAEEEKMNQ